MPSLKLNLAVELRSLTLFVEFLHRFSKATRISRPARIGILLMDNFCSAFVTGEALSTQYHAVCWQVVCQKSTLAQSGGWEGGGSADS